MRHKYMMELVNYLGEKNATEIKDRQHLIYQRKARDVKLEFFCALSWRLVSEEHKIQLFSCGWTSLNSVKNYQLWAARSCCYTIAVSCLCGCAMNQKEQIKMKTFFSSSYWYFTNLSSDMRGCMWQLEWEMLLCSGLCLWQTMCVLS